jgi:hypothetical protein
VLYSYALYYCFIIIIATDVYYRMFITTRLTLYLKSPAKGIVLRILYMLMFAAIAERPGVQGLALKVTSSRETCQLIVNHLYFICNLTVHYADTLNQAVSGTRRPNIIWWVYRQQWCLISLLFLVCNYQLLVKIINGSLWKLHCLAITTPSLLLSNEFVSTPWPDNIWDMSDQHLFFGSCNTWIVQLL